MKSCGPCGALSVYFAQACNICALDMWLGQPCNFEVSDRSLQVLSYPDLNQF